MKLVVGVGDMKVSGSADDIIVTHALGSCLGLAAYDQRSGVGGIAHLMLPTSDVNKQKAKNNPYMFVDTGFPQFLDALYKRGANKRTLKIKAAGGACIGGGRDMFEIGKRNIIMLRKLLWQNNIIIAGKDVGGNTSRTMYLEVGSGRVWVTSNGKGWDL